MVNNIIGTSSSSDVATAVIVHRLSSLGTASAARNCSSISWRGQRRALETSNIPVSSGSDPASIAIKWKYSACASPGSSTVCMPTTHLQAAMAGSSSCPGSALSARSAHSTTGEFTPGMFTINAHSMPSSSSGSLDSISTSRPTQLATARPTSSRVGASGCGQKPTHALAIGTGSSQALSPFESLALLFASPSAPSSVSASPSASASPLPSGRGVSDEPGSGALSPSGCGSRGSSSGDFIAAHRRAHGD